MKHSSFLAFLVMALVSCNSDTDLPEAIGKPVAAEVTAHIGPVSRAAGTEWGVNDRIGVSGVSGTTTYSNVEYKIVNNTLGSFTPAGAGIFYQTTDDVVFTAYYPFTGTNGTAQTSITGNTRAENQTAAAQPGIDYLWAQATGNYSDKRSVDFVFYHKMSRMSLTFISGDDINVSDLTAYSVDGLKMEGTFDTATGTATATGSIETLTINEPVLTSLILYPQATGGRVKISATVGGQTYSCNLNIAELKAGMDYDISIRVSKTGLTVTGCTIADWGNGGSFSGDATMPKPEPNVGDYYYSDGTYTTALDPSKQVIGIVFYVGRHPNDKSDYTRPLTENGPTITDGKVHGYVVALTDASDGGCMWGPNNIKLECYLKDQSGNAIDNTIGSSGNPQIEWCGYEWTQKIIAAAGGPDNLKGSIPAGYPATYYAVVAYQNRVAAPAGSSGWFLPSIGQMLGTNSLNGKIKSAGGSELAIFYQTSSEMWDDDRGKTVVHAIITNGWSTTYTKENNDHPARAILVF